MSVEKSKRCHPTKRSLTAISTKKGSLTTNLKVTIFLVQPRMINYTTIIIEGSN